eukprot:TRINITY_DN73554_c0_g1_i1.p1 TRINITY_DN73554_c0_g1~~TRINITY_DN73554_c0_g1_i1.p1  ORF type:complete len:121 (+),score=11.74 TRINITY_DN73554_c0_g1_i1:474-836(+)
MAHSRRRLGFCRPWLVFLGLAAVYRCRSSNFVRHRLPRQERGVRSRTVRCLFQDDAKQEMSDRLGDLRKAIAMNLSMAKQGLDEAQDLLAWGSLMIDGTGLQQRQQTCSVAVWLWDSFQQ